MKKKSVKPHRRSLKKGKAGTSRKAGPHGRKPRAMGPRVGKLAHDLNNQLTGIFGYLHLAWAGLPGDSPAAGHLENARQLLQRTRDLTGRLLALAKGNGPARSLPKTPPSPGLPKTRAGAGRILIMDDEEYVLDISAAFCQALGYSPVKARHGDEAVDLYKQALRENRPFRAVILDLTIPGGMGGLATLKALRETDPHVRAVATSGYSNDPVMAGYRDYGFNAALQKPYLNTELSTALADVTASSGPGNIH